MNTDHGLPHHHFTNENSEQPEPVKDEDMENEIIGATFEFCNANKLLLMPLLSEILRNTIRETKRQLSSPPEPASDRGCPCKYLDEPCHPQCTCVIGGSSLGCMYCATYGSIEQRKEAAKRIAGWIKKGQSSLSEPDSKEHTKHTPGEWFVYEKSFLTDVRSVVYPILTGGEAVPIYRNAIKNKKGNLIGGILIANAFGRTKEEAEANAKLIAAAPQLLKPSSKDQENDAVRFAKVYHNHVMETRQPPFKERLNIENLYKQWKELKNKKP